MDIQPQCPGEPYTITPLICRIRQAKGYEKCPGCAFRGPAQPEAGVPATVYVPELAAPAAGALAIQGRQGLDDLRALARRFYDYF